jgi:hypothetical protein
MKNKLMLLSFLFISSCSNNIVAQAENNDSQYYITYNYDRTEVKNYIENGMDIVDELYINNRIAYIDSSYYEDPPIVWTYQVPLTEFNWSLYEAKPLFNKKRLIQYTVDNKDITIKIDYNVYQLINV